MDKSITDAEIKDQKNRAILGALIMFISVFMGFGIGMLLVVLFNIVRY